MSKPTKEIIKLAKKLYELGYRKDMNLGDSIIDKRNGRVEMVFSTYNDDTEVLGTELDVIYKKHLIPIPSIDDGLAWLKERHDIWFCGDEDGWLLRAYVEVENNTFAYWDDKGKADTPHIAVLKAMIKVLEGEN